MPHESRFFFANEGGFFSFRAKDKKRGVLFLGFLDSWKGEGQKAAFFCSVSLRCGFARFELHLGSIAIAVIELHSDLVSRISVPRCECHRELLKRACFFRFLGLLFCCRTAIVT